MKLDGVEERSEDFCVFVRIHACQFSIRKELLCIRPCIRSEPSSESSKSLEMGFISLLKAFYCFPFEDFNKSPTRSILSYVYDPVKTAEFKHCFILHFDPTIQVRDEPMHFGF